MELLDVEDLLSFRLRLLRFLNSSSIYNLIHFAFARLRCVS